VVEFNPDGEGPSTLRYTDTSAVSNGENTELLSVLHSTRMMLETRTNTFFLFGRIARRAAAGLDGFPFGEHVLTPRLQPCRCTRPLRPVLGPASPVHTSSTLCECDRSISTLLVPLNPLSQRAFAASGHLLFTSNLQHACTSFGASRNPPP